MQSSNMVKVRTAITRMQAYDPKCFLFHEKRMHAENVYLLTGIILVMNKMRTVF